MKIDTLHNPGWTLRIELTGTDAPVAPVSRVRSERTEHDWLQWWVEDETFNAACGPTNLGEAIAAFLDFAGVRAPNDEAPSC